MAYDTMYDKEGNLISNEMVPTYPEFFGQNTHYGVKLVYVPEIGYTLTYEGKDYEIIAVTTYQEKPDKEVITTHVVKCLEIDENLEDVGNEPIVLKITDNSDKYGIVGY